MEELGYGVMEKCLTAGLGGMKTGGASKLAKAIEGAMEKYQDVKDKVETAQQMIGSVRNIFESQGLQVDVKTYKSRTADVVVTTVFDSKTNQYTVTTRTHHHPEKATLTTGRIGTDGLKSGVTVHTFTGTVNPG